MSDTQEKLANCPFCGNDDLYILDHSEIGEFAVFCNNCRIYGQSKEGHEEAVRAWNTRHTTEQKDNRVEEALKHLRGNLADINLHHDKGTELFHFQTVMQIIEKTISILTSDK